MKNQNQVTNVIRWMARIWSLASLAFLLYMIAGHIFGHANEPSPPTTSDIVTLIFFPGSTVIGLALAWKWEGLGGLITVLGMIITFIMRPDLATNLWLNTLVAPGLLFVIYWLMNGKHRNPGKIAAV